MMRHRTTNPRRAAVAALSWLALLTASMAAQCAWADCTASRTQPGWHDLNVHSGGRDRPLHVYVPSRSGHARLPLVIDLHGSNGSGLEQSRVSGFMTLAERQGFLVANPDGGAGRPGSPEAHFWNIPGVPLFSNAPVPPDTPDDVQFISDAIDAINDSLCLDTHRVYATGFSGGGRMTSLLACRLDGRLAAIAPVGGLRAGLPLAADASRLDPISCQPSKPMPVLTFHGARDPVNPYAGGGADYWQYGVDAAISRWVEIDHCNPTPVRRVVSSIVTEFHYRGCAAGSEILFYRTDAPLDQGGGHVWPGSPAALSPVGNADNGLQASELIWRFFSRHRSWGH